MRRRRPGVKLLLFAAVVASLLGILVLALVREPESTARLAPARPTIAPPRPAFTAAEEAYARALWPIHNEVKASALKLTMSAISYKLGETDRAGLRTKVETSTEVYRKAESQLTALVPPESFGKLHDDYLAAVRLYGKSASEVRRALQDGRDEHLKAAFPMSREAGLALLRVGSVLWPNEYVPN